MYIKSLTILGKNGIIRQIPFHKGINLIVDETPIHYSQQYTGNNVGKTTVLKLVDFCLGGNGKNIYVDTEAQKNEYKLVKDFLVENEVLIVLILKENLDIEDSSEIKIERNFLSRQKIIRRINDENYTEEEFERELLRLIFPEHYADKPTFRQMISHNIRYKDESLNNTLKTLDKYMQDSEYEALYLFLFGCEFTQGNERQGILSKLKQDEQFKNRLEKEQTKTAYEAMLNLIDQEIIKLNEKKTNFNLNENFEKDLEELNTIRYRINKISSFNSNLKIRKDIILESKQDLNGNISNIDLQQLRLVYEQAIKQISSIHKTFEDLVEYHNQMIIEKIKFITRDLPQIEQQIKTSQQELGELLKKESELTNLISKTETFSELEALIADLNDKYRKKGEYENIINQIDEIESEMKESNNQLSSIDDELFSDSFEQTLKNQLAKFNRYFASVSNTLYGEQYAIKYDIVRNKKGQLLYKFTAFNTNFSSGKKQGEISCFDIAYTFFADNENIPCLHFLLNDKKELMHDNQLVQIADLVNKSNIQFVASILQDKLPQVLNNEDYFVIKLSAHDKLFRIKE